jgi:hypothetical protein
MKKIRKYLVAVFIFSVVFSQDNKLTKKYINHGMSIGIGNESILQIFSGFNNSTSLVNPSFSYSIRLNNYIYEPGINHISEWGNNQTRTATIFGLGIFKSKNLNSNLMSRYFGLQFKTAIFTDEDPVQVISPTYGLEYSINANFSISGEASLNYLFDDGDNKQIDTSSKIVFRFYL